MKFGLIALLSLFSILVIAVGFLLFLRWCNKPQTNEYQFKLDRTAVVREIRQLNRLETATFTIDKIIEAGTSGNQLKQLFFGDSVLLVAHGQVIAGFDLSQIQNQDVNVSGLGDNQTVTLNLPAPQIIITDLDNQQTRVFDRKTGLFSKGDKNLEAEARLKAEQSIKQAACEDGILEQAGISGRKQLTALLYSLGFKQVQINFPAGQCL